jgi:hypothetical protein
VVWTTTWLLYGNFESRQHYSNNLYISTIAITLLRFEGVVIINTNTHSIRPYLCVMPFSFITRVLLFSIEHGVLFVYSANSKCERREKHIGPKLKIITNLFQ